MPGTKPSAGGVIGEAEPPPIPEAPAGGLYLQLRSSQRVLCHLGQMLVDSSLPSSELMLKRLKSHLFSRMNLTTSPQRVHERGSLW